ncbi:hypothetical protein BGZ50_005825 [Haplosporangium sp. Z 11]|nr:hypothetical protein BGZ50_005825 [Haplosporangium sp. Z 11]
MERLKGERLHDSLKQHLSLAWHGHQTVASELSNEMFDNIIAQWSKLSSTVRLGILFSLICMKKAHQIQLKDRCQKIIDIACSDLDEWVRLVSQMLKDYPTEGTLRFNVEQFADQAQLGALMKNLEGHISRNGIKFHPREFAYLNDSVCKAGQGKDPQTNTYPPITGPSLQRHFSLKESQSSIHKDRAEKLRKMAEQVTPIGASPSSGLSSVGVGSSAGIAGAPTSASIGGNGSNGTSSIQTSGAPVPGAPPRPQKSSSGLFVSRKPAGSFLRPNAPRPMPLPRNPSSGQLPLRSPRLDTPTTPRLNQKSSRIQILDIDQGSEIMQNMQDAKRRREEAEAQAKEQKREQRAQEQEAKRQLDAERKAQTLREREEKKKEREEAKRQKEKQAQQKRERVQEMEQQQEQERSRSRETRTVSDIDDGGESSHSAVGMKRSHPSSSRRASRDDDEYDQEQHQGSAMSPTTPTISNINQGHEHKTSMTYTPHDENVNYTNSYLSPDAHTQQLLQHQQPIVGPRDHPTLFQNTNLLTAEDRAYITAFLEGHPVIRPNGNETSYQIVMNQEQVQDPSGKIMYELILIEMNFETGEWRKIKRKRNKPHIPTPAATASAQ